RPLTYNGLPHSLPPGCFVQSGRPDSVRLAGVMLACGSGDSLSQYVQIDRTSLLATRTPDLGVRIRDHAGSLIGGRGNLFGAGSAFWGPATSLVLGGPRFEFAFGFTADAQLPAMLDGFGGTLQLVRAEAGVDRVLSELRYGPGGVAAPSPGTSLVYANGSW